MHHNYLNPRALEPVPREATAMSRDHSAVEMHGLLVMVASLVAEHKALEHVGFGSCGARA